MDQHTLLSSSRIEKLATVFLLVASVFVAALALDGIRALFDARPFIGNVISVSGRGVVTAIPDIATLSFTVTEEAVDVSSAQDAAAEKTNAALAVAREKGIAEEDIKTIYYQVSPKYSYQRPCYGAECPVYFEDAKIVGYTVSQTIELKVRDTDSAGAILSALGSAGVSNLSGPSFTIDDPEALRAEARTLAIEEAREKARALAQDLDVRLVKITGFWEEGPYYPTPYYDKASVGLGGEGVAIPELPVGEGEIAVTVNVSYEIR